MACKPKKDLADSHQQKMEQVVVAKLAEEKVPERFPHIWAPVADWSQQILKTKWLDNTKVGREAFVEGNRLALSLFIDTASIDEVETATARIRL